MNQIMYLFLQKLDENLKKIKVSFNLRVQAVDLPDQFREISH